MMDESLKCSNASRLAKGVLLDEDFISDSYQHKRMFLIHNNIYDILYTIYICIIYILLYVCY